VLAFVWDTNKRAGIYADYLEKTLDEDGEHSKLMYVRGESDARHIYLLLPPCSSRARHPRCPAPLLSRLFAQVHQEEGTQPVRQQGLSDADGLEEAGRGLHLRERPGAQRRPPAHP
jgi:hypothetical protein